MDIDTPKEKHVSMRRSTQMSVVRIVVVSVVQFVVVAVSLLAPFLFVITFGDLDQGEDLTDPTLRFWLRSGMACSLIVSFVLPLIVIVSLSETRTETIICYCLFPFAWLALQLMVVVILGVVSMAQHGLVHQD